MNTICFRCFKNTGGYEICPHCGYMEGTPNSPEYMLQPGMRIWGRYLIGTILGIGGFGVTYIAYDTRLSTIVAIKEFFPQNLATRMPGDMKIRVFSGDVVESFTKEKTRFIDEGKSLAKFTGDEHIVNVLDSFQENGTAYIVMEYLDGQTLKEHMNEYGGALSVEEASKIMVGLLAGLQAIHKKDVIHRDISPDNIYILNNGNVKIIDFGAARFAEKEEWTQSVVVKKGYAPPEQYRSNMKQGIYTDIYAAGATWYKMITGKTPEESVDRWEKDEILRPSKLVQGVDAQLDKTILKAMALRPELRFKNTETMLLALQGNTGFDYPEIEWKKRKQKRKIATVAASLMVLTIVGFLGWQFTREDPIVPVIRMEETLADMNIQPDSIVMWIGESDNKAMFDRLAEEFMIAYPEHQIDIQQKTWEEIDIYQDGDPQVPDAPDLGNEFLWDFDNRADLSILVNGLNFEDYYFLENDIKYYEFQDESGQTREIVPYIHLTADAGYFAVSSSALEQLDPSLEAITSVSDYEMLVAGLGGTWENALDGYDFWDFAGFYLPPLINEETQTFEPEPWSDTVDNYVRNWYDMSWDDELKYISNISYDVRSISDIRTTLQGDFKLLPIVHERDGQTELLDIDNDVWMCVSGYTTENKQLVAMQFIHFMFSEKGQTILTIQNQTCMPTHKNVMEDYMDLYPEAETFRPYLDGIIVNSDSNIWDVGDDFANEFQDRLHNFDQEETKDQFANDMVDYFMNYSYIPDEE